MQQADDQFDDPVLKDALKRSMPAERAPAGLRQRVVAALASERRLERRLRWQRPLYALAAAAVLLIGFGIAYQTLWNREKPAPQWFAAAMVATHAQCAGLSDHHLVAAKSTDWGIIRTALHDQLGYPILAAPLPEGWQFAGAGVCNVSNVNAAHLLFRRGDETVSVFSVPGALLYSAKPVADGATYSQMENGHAVSGFAWGGAIHCLVGSSKSGKLSLADVQKLRDSLRPALLNEQSRAGVSVCQSR